MISQLAELAAGAQLFESLRFDLADALAREVELLADLLQRIADGDRDAFALLYNRRSGTVFKQLRSILKDGAAAEDLAQEVFLAIWTHAAEFDGNKGNALGWVMVIARNRARDLVLLPQN